MNQTSSASGQSLLPETTDIFTAGHLVLIALLALIVVAGIVWGMRNARARHTAAREIGEHNSRIEQEQGSDPPQREPAEPVAPAEPPAPAPAPADSPIEPLPQPAPEAVAPEPPAAEPAPAIAAPPPVEDGPSPAEGPVTQLKGLGPKLAVKLGELGITTVGQLAALTDDDAAALDARLGPFTGRMSRDRWQEQARFLAAGDRAGFEAVFGRL